MAHYSQTKQMIHQLKQRQPQFWASFSLALLAASAFLLILVFASCTKSDIIDSYNTYLRCERLLGNVWEEGMLGPLGPSFQIQQDNTLVMLTTSALVLIVAMMDFMISSREHCIEEPT